ncbi:hypothetical protein GGS20DRAFT_48492 [Poronia punctata]|nr:hypothetical protein GGS20DRAFT_48492 [Poronia punctata]
MSNVCCGSLSHGPTASCSPLIRFIDANPGSTFQQMNSLARLAQSVERETLNLKVAGSTPASGSIPDASKLHLEHQPLFFSVFLLFIVYFIFEIVQGLGVDILTLLFYPVRFTVISLYSLFY